MDVFFVFNIFGVLERYDAPLDAPTYSDVSVKEQAISHELELNSLPPTQTDI